MRSVCLIPPRAAAQAHSGWGAVEDRRWLPCSGAKAEPLFSPLNSTDRKPAWAGSLGLQGQRS